MAHCVRCLEAISDHRLYGRICGCFPGVPNDKKQPAEMPDLIVTRGDGKALPDQPAAIREFIKASVRPTPFTTADLPHIRLDMSAPAIRARVVREALADLAMIVERDANGIYEVRLALAMLAEFADDATLDRLARMVR